MGSVLVETVGECKGVANGVEAPACCLGLNVTFLVSVLPVEVGDLGTVKFISSTISTSGSTVRLDLHACYLLINSHS